VLKYYLSIKISVAEIVSSLLRFSACSPVFLVLLYSMFSVCSLALKEVVLVVCTGVRVGRLNYAVKYTRRIEIYKSYEDEKSYYIQTIPHNMTLKYHINKTPRYLHYDLNIGLCFIISVVTVIVIIPNIAMKYLVFLIRM
jgi:hypothetical protein